MMMSIAPVAASPPSGEKQVRSTTEAVGPTARSATSPVDFTSAHPKTSTQSTSNQISFDDAGLTVVRTVSIDTGDVVAQYPTEAYLRLAHAMIDAVRAEREDKPSSDMVV